MMILQKLKLPSASIPSWEIHQHESLDTTFTELATYMHTTDRRDWAKQHIQPPMTPEEHIDAQLYTIYDNQPEHDIIPLFDNPANPAPRMKTPSPLTFPPHVTQPEENIEPNPLYTRTITIKHVQDKLFAAMYLAHHGWKHTNPLIPQFGKIDTTEKQNIIQFLQKEPAIRLSKHTNYSLTKTLSHRIMNELATCREIPLSCMIALSLYYKCNIYIIDTIKKTSIPFLHYSDNPSFDHVVHTYVFYKNPEHRRHSRMNIPGYFIDIDQSVLTTEQIHNEYLEYVTYDKPVRGMSSYKVAELEAMATKIGIYNTSEKLKKIDIYHRICVHCSTD